MTKGRKYKGAGPVPARQFLRPLLHPAAVRTADFPKRCEDCCFCAMAEQVGVVVNPTDGTEREEVGGVVYQCRKSPPSRADGRWPLVQADGWCGEWKRW